MSYLLPTQYETYGLDVETPDTVVAMASALMDSFCRRPTLLAAPYTERVRLFAGSTTLRLSYGPLLSNALASARVRYARPRRGEESVPSDHNGIFLQQVATAFGLPGSWSTLDVSTVDLYASTREVTLPANLLGLSYNEVEITYTAGFVTIPDQIVLACAQVVKNSLAIPALNVKKSRLDTLQMEYFGSNLIDESVASLLRPYRAERLG